MINKIFQRASAEWYILEYESDLYEPMIAMKKSLKKLSKLY